MQAIHAIPTVATTPSPCLAEAQSVFHPKGDYAGQIADLTWVLFVGGAVIFVLVMILTGIAVFGTPALRRTLAHRAVIIGGGIVFPVVVLSALLIYSLASGAMAPPEAKSPVARVEVTGELWWWRVRYLDDAGKPLFETANEIRIPEDSPVSVLLKSDNVIHSFWVPNLAGKIDMVPGHVNRLQLHAETPGVFRGQCAEYCGAQHAKMAFFVVAQTQAEYESWIRLQMQAAREPTEAMLVQGRQLFLDNRCGECHAIRGTPAEGRLGPDLTHLGSRLSLAAGILPNGRGTIAGWITSTQQIKPGSRMPAYHQFSGEELRALAAYLESLK